MAVTKLTCPECSTVLRPAKPLPPGKKVKCPRCDTVFTSGGDDEEPDQEEERPNRAARKAPARAGAAKAKTGKAKGARDEAPKKSGDDDEGAYKFLDDKKDEEDKPEINYAPDMSIKDLRGPAVAILMSPSNKLALMGILGVFGWLALIVMLMIPALFPLTYDDTYQDVLEIGPGLSQVSPWAGRGGMPGMGGMPGGMGGMPGGMTGGPDEKEGQGFKTKVEEEKPGFYEVFGIDLSAMCDLAWYLFIICLLPLVLLTCYSGLVAFGAIKMQNLESRPWGIASSIMAMVPLNMGGFMLASAMVANVVQAMIFDDFSFIMINTIILMSIEWLLSVGAGVYALMTLFNEKVIAGFEYVAE